MLERGVAVACGGMRVSLIYEFVQVKSIIRSPQLRLRTLDMLWSAGFKQALPLQKGEYKP